MLIRETRVREPNGGRAKQGRYRKGEREGAREQRREKGKSKGERKGAREGTREQRREGNEGIDKIKHFS